MLAENTDNIYLMGRFESLSDFVLRSKEPFLWDENKNQDGRPNPNWPHTSRGHSKWSGGSYPETLEAALEGWPEGRNLISDKVKEIARTRGTMTKSVDLDVGGSHPIVPLAVAGDPACMVNEGVTMQASHPVVRLVIQGFRSAKFSIPQCINYGAALISWADNLERAGYRLEIEWIVCAKDKVITLHEVHLKSPDEPIDIDRLSFALAHPAMYRNHMGAIYYLHRPLERKNPGWGTPYDAQKYYPDESSIYISGMNGARSESAWNKAESSLKEIERQIRTSNLAPKLFAQDLY